MTEVIRRKLMNIMEIRKIYKFDLNLLMEFAQTSKKLLDDEGSDDVNQDFRMAILLFLKP